MLERALNVADTNAMNANRRGHNIETVITGAGVIVGVLGALSCMGAGWLPMALLGWALSKNPSRRFQAASAGVLIGVAIGIGLMILMSALGMLRA